MTRLLISASMIALLAGIGPAFASPPLPAGGVFTQGTGSISTSGSSETVTIDGTGSAATISSGGTFPVVINWKNGFDIAKGGTVNFVPGSASIGEYTSVSVVNLDQTGAESLIDGAINSPDFPQVIVSTGGISVGQNAVLPNSFVLAAGSYNQATDGITADQSPVTISPGAVVSSAATLLGGGGTLIPDVSEQTGDTLPDESPSNGVYTGFAGVVVPSGSPSSFVLQPGQTGAYNFIGSAPTAITSAQPSGPISISGSGVTVGSVIFQDTSSMSLSNIGSTGYIVASAGGSSSELTAPPHTLSLSGRFSAAMPGPTTATGQTVTMGFSSFGQSPQVAIDPATGLAYAAPSPNATGTVDVAPGTVFGSSADISGDNVALGGAVQFDNPNREAIIDSVNAITGGSVSDTGNLLIGASAVSGMTITGGGRVGVNADTISSVKIDAAGDVGVGPSAYTENSTPPGVSPAALTVDSSSIVGNDISVEADPEVASGAGVADSVVIDGSTLTSSTGSLGGGIAIEAGSSDLGVPGQITITDSTVQQPGGVLSVVAADGGKITIGAGSKVSTNLDGACSSTGSACDTGINAGSTAFANGNTEFASGENVDSGPASGVSDGTPAEQATGAMPGTGTSGVLVWSQSGGAVTLTGELDAGHTPTVTIPPVVTKTPPVTTTPVVTKTPPATTTAPVVTKAPPVTTTAPPAVIPPAVTKTAPVVAEPKPAPVPVVASPSIIEITPSNAVDSTVTRGNTVLISTVPDASPSVTISPAASDVSQPSDDVTINTARRSR